jgi:mitochondrial fission protein ELM1
MNNKHIWILDEGSQGHLVQSRGLIRELAKALPLEVSEIPVRSVLSGRLGRSTVKRLLRHLPKMWLFRCLHPAMRLPQTAPGLIVSSGPHSLAVLSFLARHYGCPSVFVQGTIHVPEGAVTVIMRPFEGSQRGDYLFIPLLFTEITPQVVEAAKAAYLAEGGARAKGPVNSLFIGNSSAKIRFTPEDWNGIARFVNEVWKNEGTQWLITTSYRTGRELEDQLRSRIEPDAILEAVWYSQAPRKVTKAFLGLADRIFVTMDSLTMLTEAVASGRPTCALCPTGLPEERSNTHLQYALDLAANGFISRIEPGREAEPPPIPLVPPPVDYTGAIRELITRLQWNA